MDEINLTKKQQKIYDLMLQDMSVADISKELNIPRINVRYYIKVIENKMGVEKEVAPTRHPDYNRDLLRGIAVLNMLRTGDRVKLDTMAEKLEISKRTIRRDIASLIHGGYRIHSFYGKTGGYELRNEVITEDEWAIIQTLLSPQLYLKLRKRIDEF